MRFFSRLSDTNIGFETVSTSSPRPPLCPPQLMMLSYTLPFIATISYQHGSALLATMMLYASTDALENPIPPALRT